MKYSVLEDSSELARHHCSMAVNSSVAPVKKTSKSFLQSNYPVFVSIIADFKLLLFS